MVSKISRACKGGRKMKLDYAIIKEILIEIETQTDGITRWVDHVKNVSPEDEKLKAYHLKILVDAGIIDGRIAKYDFMDGGGEQKIIYTGLTLSGHEFLEAIRNDTLWNKIKDNAIEAGIAGLKQIPTLAIKLLLGVVQ